MPDDRPRRSIVLPAYNESEHIATMVADCLEAAGAHPEPFEVLVVDDGSTDDTAEIVARLSKDDDRVRLVRQPENGRYAAACLAGTQAAQGERVFVIDSDGQHDPRDLWAFDAVLDRGVDLVLGWRQQRSEPLFRLALSRVFRLMAWWYLGFNQHDVNTGIRAFSRPYADRLEIRYRLNYVNPELFVRARLGGFSVGEAPTVQRPRQGGETSHDFSRLGRIFSEIHRYLRGLSGELKAAGLRRR